MKLSFFYTMFFAVAAIHSVTGSSKGSKGSKGSPCCIVCDPDDAMPKDENADIPENAEDIPTLVANLELEDDERAQFLAALQGVLEADAEFLEFGNGEIWCEFLAKFSPLWTWFPDGFCKGSQFLFKRSCMCGDGSNSKGKGGSGGRKLHDVY